ncbi:MAG: double-stranded RNA binding motif domain-containing protein, partial [Planctomycetota bacterium]
TPHYLLLDEQGPDHAKCFEICVEIANRRFESCWGPNKKAAEQQAALLTLQELGAADIDDNGAVMLIEGSDLDTDGVLELD